MDKSRQEKRGETETQGMGNGRGYMRKRRETETQGMGNGRVHEKEERD